jgi:hypothetical protein
MNVALRRQAACRAEVKRRLDARGGAKLFYLFDDGRFDNLLDWKPDKLF